MWLLGYYGWLLGYSYAVARVIRQVARVFAVWLLGYPGWLLGYP